MRQLKLLIIVFAAILILLPNAIVAQKSKLLKPTNTSSKVYLVINGKNRVYYSLPNNEHTILNVRGPGKLKVITRARFGKKLDSGLNYQIFYKIDGGHENNVKFSGVQISKTIVYKNGDPGIPGVGKDFEIEVGVGQHTIEIWQSNRINVDARFVFKSGKIKKQKWSALCPADPNEPIDLVYDENVVHYYRFSNEKPLRIKVIGPTTLRLLTRIENHYQMKGRINYRLQVKEDREIKNTYFLSSVRSEVVSYKNNKKLIPGKAREIVIMVPGGVHNYEVIPLDKNKSTVLGRIMLPSKDLKLEE